MYELHNICKLSHDIKHFVLQFWAIPNLAVGPNKRCMYPCLFIHCIGTTTDCPYLEVECGVVILECPCQQV